jgi:hypothetical protein
MSSGTNPGVPTSPVYFAPLIGLRRGRLWKGLLGLELKPGTLGTQQQPRWKLLAWNEPAPGVSTIYGLFADSFSTQPDHLRYVGRWLPTSGVNSATQVDYGAAYQAAERDFMSGFDQAGLHTRDELDEEMFAL